MPGLQKNRSILYTKLLYSCHCTIIKNIQCFIHTKEMLLNIHFSKFFWFVNQIAVLSLSKETLKKTWQYKISSSSACSTHLEQFPFTFITESLVTFVTPIWTGVWDTKCKVFLFKVFREKKDNMNNITFHLGTGMTFPS